MTATASFGAFGTTATVVVADRRALSRAVEVLVDVVASVDAACSRFRSDSELSFANRSAGRRVPASPLFLEAVAVALAAAESSGGVVSPVLGRSLRLAGYDRTFRLVREREGWSFAPDAPPLEAWRGVEVDADRGEVLVPEGTELDLGATAKALAADRAAAAAAGETGSGVLVSIGGDVAVAGDAPDGGWPVRIADDHAAPLDGQGPVVGISSGGLATSSTTVRRWSTGRGVAHHVLDPSTGRPVDSPWRTVTVAAASCVDADVAALAGLVLGRGAIAWLEERHLPARLVEQEGVVITTEGWPREAALA